MKTETSNFKSKCLKPIWLKKSEIYVPCGQCLRCQKSTAMGWIVRLSEELKLAKSAHFMTYTYDETKVPLTKLAFQTLDKSHLTNYYKQLRNLHVKRYKTNVPIRYFACGEYGSETHRPHYHDILMNADIDLIEEAWKHGKIFRGDVTLNSIGYVTGYLLKTPKNPDPVSDEILKFRRMSKGLGEAYVKKQMIDWHSADPVNRYYYPQHSGKLSLPRYLKQKLFTTDQRELITQHFQNQANMDENKLSTKQRFDLINSEIRKQQKRRDF